MTKKLSKFIGTDFLEKMHTESDEEDDHQFDKAEIAEKHMSGDIDKIIKSRNSVSVHHTNIIQSKKKSTSIYLYDLYLSKNWIG